MESHKKHILVVSQYFYPEQFRINDMCLGWVQRGYKVSVITGIPNYPEGRFYSGYNYVQKRVEKWNGIWIYRIPLIPRGNNALGMVANYLSFVFSGFMWKTLTKLRADEVFIFEVSPMTQALPGIWYAKRRKIPCYLYVQDLWPENVEIVTGIHNRIVIGAIRHMVSYIYKRCDHIFATSTSFVDKIREYPIESDKVSYLPQYAEDFYRPINVGRHDQTLRVTYTGNIGYAQGLDILPALAQKCKEKNISVQFQIVGNGRYQEELVRQIQAEGVADMFVLQDRVPALKIPDILARADLVFLSFADNELWSMTIPAKLQSYMACGKPILAAVSGESARIIRDAGCGMVSDIGNVDGLVSAIERYLGEPRLLTEQGNRARKYAEVYFNKQKLLDEIDKWLR